MKSFYVRKLLDKEHLDYIKNILNESNEKNFWEDGLNSGGGYRHVKNNLENSNIEFSSEINKIVMSCLDKDSEFLGFTCARSTNLNIISKTISGGYYNPHFDNWSNGHYSTTVFLNDPDEYDGGELCLLINDKEEKIKLDAGWAITYSTGTLHRVNKVISGVRYASVFWTESLLKDSFIREIYYQLSKLSEIYSKKEKNSIHMTNCLVAQNDPEFVINNIKNELLRRYGVK